MRNSLAYAFLLAGFAASAQAAHLEENGYRDRLSTLTWNGVTLYGVVDIGYVYQTHGAPLSGALPTGLEYRAFSAKNLRGPISSLAENGSEQSSVGLKIEEAIVGGWVALGKLDTGFNPLSGEIADSCASLGRNNGRNQLTSTSNSDGNRCGQALNGPAFAGVSSPSYGTLTAGRQDSLDLNLMANFDPMALAPAFSLAISSASFNGNNSGLPCPGAGCPSNFLSGTITDDKTWTIGGKYSFELDDGLKDEVAASRLTLFTGYQYSDRANPAAADQAPAGTTTIGGYILAKVDNQP
jgi:predicted porin